jgi:hypothetical protein
MFWSWTPKSVSTARGGSSIFFKRRSLLLLAGTGRHGGAGGR